MNAGQVEDSLRRFKPDLAIISNDVKYLTPIQLLTDIQALNLDTFTMVLMNRPEFDQGMDYLMAGVFGVMETPADEERLKILIEQGLENKEAFHQVVALTEDLSQANLDLEREKETLKQKTKDLKFLNELGANLSTDLDFESIARTVLDALSKETDANLAALAVQFDPESAELAYVNMSTPDIWHDRLVKTILGLKTLHDPAAVSDLSEGKHHFNFQLWPKFRRIFPLVAAGEKYGGLALFFNQKTDFSPDRALLIKNAVLQASQALYNAEQHRRALTMASQDALTGLLNRRAFDDIFAAEFERHKRYKNPMSIIMIDLDHFKAVNDNHGHQVGDDVLKTTAEIIELGVRGSDWIARIGGEEFVVLLPNTDEKAAILMADRIRKALKHTIIPVGSALLRQTASFGVAGLPSSMAKTVDDLLKLADQALYRAKSKGRDRVCGSKELIAVQSEKETAYAGKQ